jgi:bacteriochlorophyll 4-vinyl reductase
MQDQRIPSLLLNILFAQVDETMGHRSLNMLLRQAGLGEYVDWQPPMSDTPSMTVAQYSRLLANVYDVLGARAAAPLFVQCGRLEAAEMRRQRPAKFALRGTALRFLPGATRMRRLLEQLAEHGQELYGSAHHLREEDAAFLVEIEDCPYCAEIARRQQAAGKAVARPVCHIPAAILDEMLEWVTGQRHLVEETACIALGDPTCRFRIAK